MSEQPQTITIDNKVYAVEGLPEAAIKSANGFIAASQKMNVAKMDFELSMAARDYFGALAKEAVKDVEPLEVLPEEAEVVEDDSTGTD